MTVDYLFRAMQAAGRSEEIEYRRGGVCLATLPAVRGRTEVDVLDEDTVINAMSDDWIVQAVSLVTDDEKITPQTGDQIVLGTEIYEVLPNIRNGPVYRKSDPAGKVLRIHSKLQG